MHYTIWLVHYFLRKCIYLSLFEHIFVYFKNFNTFKQLNYLYCVDIKLSYKLQSVRSISETSLESWYHHQFITSIFYALSGSWFCVHTCISLHCMCQHLHITLFSLILSFHLSLIPLNRFHLGDVNFCLEQIQMPIRHTHCKINLRKYFNKYSNKLHMLNRKIGPENC